MSEDENEELQQLVHEQGTKLFIEELKESTKRVEEMVERLRKEEEEHYEYFWG